MTVDPTKVREFESEQHFYDWLREHGEIEREVWIRIFKVRSGVRSISPAQAIDPLLGLDRWATQGPRRRELLAALHAPRKKERVEPD